MLQQKIVCRDSSVSEPFDLPKIVRSRETVTISVIPGCLPDPNFSKGRKLGCGEALLGQVIVKEHGAKVTSLGTNVNRLFADRR